jgi:hypothetical protein
MAATFGAGVSYRAGRSTVRRSSTEQLDALVQLGGLEPPTSCSTDRRSNQLSYNCILDRPRKGVAERGGN